MDPRTKDAIRGIPGALKAVQDQMVKLEEKIDDIHKFTRSTNESVVRKYGGGKKNTATKVAERVLGKKK